MVRPANHYASPRIRRRHLRPEWPRHEASTGRTAYCTRSAIRGACAADGTSAVDCLAALAAFAGLARPCRASAVGQGLDGFRQFVEALWPEARGQGRVARQLRCRLQGGGPRPVAPRPRAARQDPAAMSRARPSSPERPRSTSNTGQLARLAGAGQGAPREASRGAREDRARDRRAAPGRARHLGARDRLHRAPLFALCHSGARHPGLDRPPQGDVPQRAPAMP